MAQAEMLIRMLLARFSVDASFGLGLDAYLVTHAFAGICSGNNKHVEAVGTEDVADRKGECTETYGCDGGNKFRCRGCNRSE